MTARGRRAARTAAGLIAALALVAALAPAVAAAAITFGTPTASSAFGKGLDFVQPVSGGGGYRHVDIVIDYPGAAGPAATQVEVTSGSAFEYHLDTSKGQLVPNTTLTVRWRVTFEDGTTQTGPDVTVTYADTRFDWRTRTAARVRLHWYQGDDAFADRALAIGEQGVEKAASFMGATDTKPIDFFVYADQRSFYDALGPGTRENVGGEAHSDIRTLFALIGPAEVNSSWVSIVIPHELTHVVFDDVVHNPYHAPPHWLNEGVAVYLTQGFDASDRAAVRNAVDDGSIMPLEALRGQFPTVADRFNLGYSESVSAVDYLVRKHGKDALVKLIRAYGGGVSDDTAFRQATGTDALAFDAAWLQANGAGSPKKYGPVPGPTGPLPPGWTAQGGPASPEPSGSPASGKSVSPDASASADANATPGPDATPDARPASNSTPSGGTVLLAVGAFLVVAVVAGTLLVLRLASRREGTGGGQ